MNSFGWQRLLFHDASWSFLGEITFRVLVAYLLVFLFLKFSGRRGIRQLSIFELVAILILGSSAGDVTYREDVPLVPVAGVFVSLLVFYRATTWVMNRSERVTALVDGKPVILIRDGLYDLDTLMDLNVSEDEFFMELRQQSVEHLGQVRLGILETDGEVSLFFFESESVRPGLSVMPPELRPEYSCAPDEGRYACNQCGFTLTLQAQDRRRCPRCNKQSWSKALANARVS